jgi:hypothetical protein
MGRRDLTRLVGYSVVPRSTRHGPISKPDMTGPCRASPARLAIYKYIPVCQDFVGSHIYRIKIVAIGNRWLIEKKNFGGHLYLIYARSYLSNEMRNSKPNETTV